MCEEIGKLAIGTYDGILLCYRIWKIASDCTEFPSEIPPGHTGFFAHLLFNEHPHPSAIRSLAGSQYYLSSGGYDGSISLFDVRSLKFAGNLTSHDDSVDSMEFYESSYLVTGSADKTICLWRISDISLMKRLIGHTSGVTAIAVSPTGKFMLSTGKDGILRMWDLMRGHNARTRNIGVSPTILLFSEDSRQFIFGYDKEISVVDGTTEASLCGLSQEKVVSAASVDRDVLWVGTVDGHVFAWSLKSGELLGEYMVATNRIKFVRAVRGYVFILTAAGEAMVGVVSEEYEVDTVLSWSIDNRITCGAFLPPVEE
jgi:protein MAK11